ncbi:hypothetical protein KC992_00840 [Candidatus Saccharibacteria bacterium]|nr:hypothetical protein [Candidatus Saccharibacteria bacterium]
MFTDSDGSIEFPRPIEPLSGEVVQSQSIDLLNDVESFLRKIDHEQFDGVVQAYTYFVKQPDGFEYTFTTNQDTDPVRSFEVGDTVTVLATGLDVSGDDIDDALRSIRMYRGVTIEEEHLDLIPEIRGGERLPRAGHVRFMDMLDEQPSIMVFEQAPESGFDMEGRLQRELVILAISDRQAEVLMDNATPSMVNPNVISHMHNKLREAFRAESPSRQTFWTTALFGGAVLEALVINGATTLPFGSVPQPTQLDHINELKKWL